MIPVVETRHLMMNPINPESPQLEFAALQARERCWESAYRATDRRLWGFRARRDRRKAMVTAAIDAIESRHLWAADLSQDEYKDGLIRIATGAARAHLGFGPFSWIALEIFVRFALPIILSWWLNRDQTPSGQEAEK